MVSGQGELTARIPLRARDGSVRAWVIVDAEDYDRLTAMGRWSMGAGYAQRRYEGRMLSMHRAVVGLFARAERGVVVDHINRDKLDNRKANLRIVDLVANRQNSAWEGRGVGRHPAGGWRARVVVNDREICKRTRSREEAERVVRELRAIHHPYSPEAAA